METKAAPQQPRRERDRNLIVIGRRKPADNLHADAEAVIRTTPAVWPATCDVRDEQLPAKFLYSAQLQYGAYSDI
jgi:hypothetical protein